MKTALAAVAALLIMAGAAEAACTPRNLAGNWTLTASSGVTCSLRITTASKLSAACRLTRSGQKIGTLSGKLKVSKACQVTGTVQQYFRGDRDTLTVTGKIAGNKSQMSGIGVGRRDEGFRFTARKR